MDELKSIREKTITKDEVRFLATHWSKLTSGTKSRASMAVIANFTEASDKVKTNYYL